MIDSNQAYLVYFNCRGTGHYYRYALFEIGIPFQEIYVQADGKLPQSLKQFNINLADIPCIVYDNRVIKDLYPTLRFLCRKFNRQDLLGTTVYQQAKISQLFCKNSKKKSQAISTFLNFVPMIKKNPEDIKKIKEEMVLSMSDTPGCSEACSLLYAQTGGLMFGHLTIADFLFYENCYYFAGFFGDVCRRKYPILLAYKNFFQSTEFYKKNKQRIQGFKLVIPEFDQTINEGFKLMWIDKKIPKTM